MNKHSETHIELINLLSKLGVLRLLTFDIVNHIEPIYTFGQYRPVEIISNGMHISVKRK